MKLECSVHDLFEVWKVLIYSPLATTPCHPHHHFTASASSRVSQSLSASQRPTAAQWPSASFFQANFLTTFVLCRSYRFVYTGSTLQASTSSEKSGQLWTVSDSCGRVWTNLSKLGQIWTNSADVRQRENTCGRRAGTIFLTNPLDKAWTYYYKVWTHNPHRQANTHPLPFRPVPARPGPARRRTCVVAGAEAEISPLSTISRSQWYASQRKRLNPARSRLSCEPA